MTSGLFTEVDVAQQRTYTSNCDSEDENHHAMFTPRPSMEEELEMNALFDMDQSYALCILVGVFYLGSE